MDAQSQPQDHAANESKAGHHLPHPHYHAHPTPSYAVAHADDHPNQEKPGSGTSTPKHHYHVHKTPQYFAGHAPDGESHLTAEQNAENLAKYQREHADLIARNLISHGGHSEGDAYTPSKAAHHAFPHFNYHMHQSPQYFTTGYASHDKPKSGTSTPRDGDHEKHGSGVHLPHYHAHQTPQIYNPQSFAHDKPKEGV